MAGSNAPRERGREREGEGEGDRGGRRRWRRLLDAVSELLWFLVLLTLWTVGLALLFLATDLPRWAFYASVLVGVVVFATLYPERPSA